MLNRADNIIKRNEFPTTDPQTTLSSIKEWLLQNEVIDHENVRYSKFTAIGVASFGPVDAKKGSNTYGFITSTPKHGWKDTNVLQLLGCYDNFKDIPCLFDTDVNAPALAEYILNKNSNTQSCAYVTIGTGVGVGLVINGMTVHGLVHPEGGHIQVRRKSNDNFAGTCPFHGCCIEGMCSTGALASRLGVTVKDLPMIPEDSEIWDILAYYIAQLCYTLILTTSTEKIVLGGGVMNRVSLLNKIHRITLQLLNSYIVHDYFQGITSIEKYITLSTWGPNTGIIGAGFLAMSAADVNK